MSGYSHDFSMSNNAIAAYNNGLLPASKIKGIPAALIKQFCHCEEWHHSSKNFNCVNFYNESYVLATFGIPYSKGWQENEAYEINPDAVAALENYKKSKKDQPTVLMNCKVEWIEWSGSLKRPRATEMQAAGCTVSVKGQTAIITLPNGNRFIKRLSTNGFKFQGE